MLDKNTITNAAQKYASRGQIQEAIAEWEKLLSVNQDGNVYNTIGDLYLKKREQQKAIESFEKAANIFREDGFYPKAIALFKKILNIAPEEVSALIALAQLNAERGFTNQAVDELHKVAEIFIKRNNLEKALEVYERILRLTPLHTGHKLKIAELAQQAGMTGKASQGYGVVAADHLEKGEFNQAKENYQKALDIDPRNSSALIGLSNLSDRIGKTEEALQYLNQAIADTPEDQSILLRYARLLIKADKIDEARQTLKNIIEKDPSNLGAKKLLGIMYNDEGQIEEAWNELQPCIDDEISDRNWADALAMLNNFEELNSVMVRQRFMDIYRGNGDNDSLLSQLKGLGALLENNGSDEEALKRYKEALDIRSDDPELKEKVYRLESTVNKSEEEQTGPADDDQSGAPAAEGDAMYHQYLDAKKTEADFYVQQGLNEEAVHIYEELIETYPEDEGIIKAMSALKTPDGSIINSNPAQEHQDMAQSTIHSAKNDVLHQGDDHDHASDDGTYEELFQKGIDYKRQGQLDEAIQELKKALDDPLHVVRNSRMLAMCFMEKGNVPEAIGQYERALNEISPEGAGFLDIQYELAGAYMQNNDQEKALKRYLEINSYDATFRDVAQTLESLQPAPPAVDEAPLVRSGIAAVKTGSKKNRISYL